VFKKIAICLSDIPSRAILQVDWRVIAAGEALRLRQLLV